MAQVFELFGDLNGLTSLDLALPSSVDPDHTFIVCLGWHVYGSGPGVGAVAAYLVDPGSTGSATHVRVKRQTSAASTCFCRVWVITDPAFDVWHYTSDAAAPWAAGSLVNFTSVAKTNPGWTVGKALWFPTGIQDSASSWGDQDYVAGYIEAGGSLRVESLSATNTPEAFGSVVNYAGWDVTYFTTSGLIDTDTHVVAGSPANNKVLLTGSGAHGDPWIRKMNWTAYYNAGTIFADREGNNYDSLFRIGCAVFSDDSLVQRAQLVGDTTDITVGISAPSSGTSVRTVHSCSSSHSQNYGKVEGSGTSRHNRFTCAELKLPTTTSVRSTVNSPLSTLNQTHEALIVDWDIPAAPAAKNDNRRKFGRVL